jgi:hypothetical protein
MGEIIGIARDSRDAQTHGFLKIPNSESALGVPHVSRDGNGRDLAAAMPVLRPGRSLAQPDAI